MAISRDAMEGRGECVLFTGCMFASKTGALLSALRREAVISDTEVLCIKYAGDTRYTTDGILAHSGEEMRPEAVVTTSHLGKDEIQDRIRKADVIGIDEAQFFSDLHLVEEWMDNGKIVYLAALNGDHARKPWPNLAPIWPLVTDLFHLKARCYGCGKAAVFSFDFHGGSTGVEAIGGEERYRPLCQNCYLEAKHEARGGEA